MSKSNHPNSGALFKNDRKRDDRNDPDYTGQCQIGKNGDEFWLSAWVKKPEGKKPFMSLSFKAKQQQHREEDEDQSLSQRRQPPPPPPADDDEIPF